uniref:Nuclear nucleic acid-binding protein C1D n=1 Tax=Trichuris muris TaxID=70415 RepID=A0A5S6R4P3_TRIMR
MGEELVIDDKYVDLHAMVEQLEEMVERFTTAMPLAERVQENSDLQNARMYAELMYILNTLYWCQLKLQRCDTSNHPIMKELNAIRQKMKQIRELELSGKGPKLDLPAVKRLIQHDLWSMESTCQGTSSGSQGISEPRKRRYSESSEEGELPDSSDDNEPTASSGRND